MSPSATHRHFHDELAELKAKLLTLSGEAEAALSAAVQALLHRDAAKAAMVIAGDDTLNDLENQVEDAVVQLLATQQPMARDLRLLMAALKIANDLERVGDHAVNIAQSVERLIAYRPITPEPELVEMARQAGTMLADAMGALVRGDAPARPATCPGDDPGDAPPRPKVRILVTDTAGAAHPPDV